MTCGARKSQAYRTHFNSHAHVERDANAASIPDIAEDFNSHAHVERDIMDKETWLTADDFNSHAHVERDSKEGMAIR